MRQVTPVAPSERPRRQSPAPERRRGDLLDAAAALFAAHGIEATSVAAIAEAAGVAKGSFYRYFASREELLAALKVRFVDDLLAAVTGFADRLVGGADDWWRLSDEFVAAMVTALFDRRDLIRVFSAQPSTPENVALFTDTEERIDAFIAAGIEAGVATGEFRVADPAATATLLQHALFSTVEHAIVHGRGLDADRLVAAMQRLTRAALREG